MNARYAAIPALLLLTACALSVSEPQPTTRQPKRAGEASPAHLAGHILAADAAAVLGDRKAIHTSMDATQAEFRKSLRMADPGRPIDRELARAAAKRVPAVRSAVWLDRENLFVIVKENVHRSQQTIDQICIELEPLGDTLAIVVNVQSGAAISGDDLEILSRNCQLDSGERAFLQKNRQVDVLSPAIRAQHKANNAR